MTDPPRTSPGAGEARPRGWRERWSAVHTSVFAKLVAIMVTMTACLLLLVGSFFLLIVSPYLTAGIDRLVEEYTRTLAASSPDFWTAKRLGARLDLQVRYEGRGGDWSTASDLPTVDQVRGGLVRGLSLRHYSLVPAPAGGTYLFAWNPGGNMNAAHVAALVLLLLVIAAIVLTTHIVLTRLLRPLQMLNDGVARLSDGQLDVQLPNRTRDEFGRLTDTFNQMVGRVRGMIGARDQLLLDVSHELRSPLTRMKVALELLTDNEQRTRLAADVADMELMVTELLEMERLRGGRGISIARENLIPILGEVAQRFHDRRPGLRIVSTSAEMLVDIDGIRVRTVLRNLLDNAAKYSLPDSRAVEISAVQNADAVVIRISDDGLGIPESDVARVFEPFFRVDRSRSRKTGGYGLGLGICQRVMEAHGGSIAVERQPGRGTSFVLTFPKAASAKSA